MVWGGKKTSLIDRRYPVTDDLWDDLAPTPEAVPVYEWQKEELARRNANLQQHPGSLLSWDEVKRRIRSQHGR